MTRFPTYPTDILSRADAMLAAKYPVGIVDPLLAEVACEAMMAQREFDAAICEAEAKDFLSPQYASNQPFGTIPERFACECCAKAIRGTE